jgi:sugar diacid utilization regulator
VDAGAAFPDRLKDADFLELLKASILENLRNIQRYLEGTLDLDDLALDEPVRFARQQAEIGSSQNALQHSYRLGMHLAIEDWGTVVIEAGIAFRVPATELAPDLLASVSRVIEYTNAVQWRVAAEFADRQEEIRRTGQQIRERLVLDLLDRNEAVEARDFMPILGYDLGQTHLAIQLDQVEHGEAVRFGEELRRKTKASGTLSLRRGVAETILWLSRPGAWPDSVVRRLIGELRRDGRTASVAGGAPGIAGLRQTYGELHEMASLRTKVGDIGPVIYYPKVQLDILLLQSPEAARRFVTGELGELANDQPGLARLRETIAASYVHGSHVQTALALGVHEQTVRNRLRRAEEILGHSLSDRRTEVQVALRLLETIGP